MAPSTASVLVARMVSFPFVENEGPFVWACCTAPDSPIKSCADNNKAIIMLHFLNCTKATICCLFLRLILSMSHRVCDTFPTGHTATWEFEEDHQ